MTKPLSEHVPVYLSLAPLLTLQGKKMIFLLRFGNAAVRKKLLKVNRGKHFPALILPNVVIAENSWIGA